MRAKFLDTEDFASLKAANTPGGGVRHFPDWIKAYAQYTKHSEAPDIFHFWAGVSAIGGALRRKVYFDQKLYAWSPNFYIIFVAPPGIATKTTALNSSMSMLREVPMVKMGPNSMTWQSLLPALAEAKVEWNISGSGIIDRVSQAMCCLTFAAGEFGNLIRFDDPQLIDLLVSLWDGLDRYEKITKTKGADDVPHPWINIIAAVTPAWLQTNMPKITMGGGFFSRCIFVFADAKRKLVPYPADHMTEASDQLKKDLIADLCDIAQMQGAYTLTPEAKEWASDWYISMGNKLQYTDNSETSANFKSRIQCHVHKLAMVLEASRSEELLIHLDTVQHAAFMIEQVEAALPRVFHMVETVPEMQTAETLFAYIRKTKRINETLLYNQFMGSFRGTDEFEKAINAGIKSGKLVKRQEGNTINIIWDGEEDADTPSDPPLPEGEQ